ncbi:hypothetical protein BH11ACT8_BH11ACT8_04470 [soil metagenome]
MDELDRIDRSIDIDATAEKVWALVSRPGWWINSRTIVDNPRTRRVGGVDVVQDPVHGTFPIATERLDPPSYAAFRWLTTTDEGDRPGTLVEFFVTDRPGGVTLRVVESGFSSLDEERDAWLKMREGNVEGWAIELEAFRVHHDPTTLTRAVAIDRPVEVVRDTLPSWAAEPGDVTVEVEELGAGSLVVVRVTGLSDLEATERAWDAALTALVARHASVAAP